MQLTNTTSQERIESEFERKKREREEQAEAKTSKNRNKRMKKKARVGEKEKTKTDGTSGGGGEGMSKKRRLVNGKELVFKRRDGSESEEDEDIVQQAADRNDVEQVPGAPAGTRDLKEAETARIVLHDD
jgi:hypothetical protein